MLHPLVRWIGRRALRWYYRDLSIVGVERIPAAGAVLLVGNHPNDLPDVLIGYLATDRPVRYVATSAAATSPMVRWTYEGLAVIPVTRVRDARKMKARGVDMAAANRVAFQRVTDAWAGRDIVGVFPEGGVHAGPGIGPIRSGVAKLALESTLDGLVTGLTVIAIGVQYEAPDSPESDVMAIVGEPLPLDDWLVAAAGRPHSAFTVELRRMLEAVSRTAITAAEAMERDRIVAAVGASIAAADEAPMAAAHRALASWHRMAADPDAAAAIATLSDQTARAGGRGTSAADCRRVIETASGGGRTRPVWLVALAPFAILGLAVHAIPFALSRWISGKVSESASDRAARTIVPGLYLMFVWYAGIALLLALALRRVSPSSPDLARWQPMMLASAIAFLLLLPRLGDLAVRWRRELRAFRLERRVRGLSDVERAAIRTSAHALRDAHAAWVSHLHGSEVSVLA